MISARAVCGGGHGGTGWSCASRSPAPTVRSPAASAGCCPAAGTPSSASSAIRPTQPTSSADGVEPVVLDLESASVDDVARRARRAPTPSSSPPAPARAAAPPARTPSTARAAVLLADAAERAGVRRYLLVSSMGVGPVADGATPDGIDEVFAAYLRAKLAAEEDVLARPGLSTTVLRPGGLTDDPGTGRVTLGPARRAGAASPGRRRRRARRAAGRRRAGAVAGAGRRADARSPRRSPALARSAPGGRG